MPVKQGLDKNGHFYRYGKLHKYYFNPENKASKTRAFNKAKRQGIAIRIHEEKGGSVVNKIKETFKRIIAFIRNKYRNHLSEEFYNNLQKYGNRYITQIHVYREPLNKIIQSLGNLTTLGKLKQQQVKLGYDNLYHLYMVLDLEGGKSLLLEKTQIPRLTTKISKSPSQINFQPRHRVKLIDFINNTIKVMKDDYFTYTL